MKNKATKRCKCTTLFLDVGGVLLTNGWDRQNRLLAAQTFHLDYDEMESRHHLTFDTYEVGKLSLDEYLHRVVFYTKRYFTQAEFEEFMFSCSTRLPEMIEYITELKTKHHLKVVVVSNEGRELTEYRIKKFKLAHFVDFFVSSCFVHLRKPDVDIYRMALDIAQVNPENVIYIDDRRMFVQVAQGLGIEGICHRDYLTTREHMEKLGLKLQTRDSI